MTSWGGLGSSETHLQKAHWRSDLQITRTPILAVGNGRSYGDVCLCPSGQHLSLSGMDRIYDLDTRSGLLHCEAGITLGDINRVAGAQGWMLPVVPGTQAVTVGGAIANDIHGKNHHNAGTFGCYVESIELQSTAGDRTECSKNVEAGLFSATIGGLGLTGIIVSAKIQLVPQSTGLLDAEMIRFSSLDEFFELDKDSVPAFEHTVAWFDCQHPGPRGIYERANPSTKQGSDPGVTPLLTVPVKPPVSPLNRITLKAFNLLYFYRPIRQSRVVPYSAWMYPLDRIGHWNFLYGNSGFRQYQCVVPEEAVSLLLDTIRSSGMGSMLAVLKSFGDRKSPAIMSFPRPGYTLALDFPWRGDDTEKLFERLDAIVRDHDGAIYAAKDAHMQGTDFRRSYPGWELVNEHKDPGIDSVFWQRVMT